MEGESKDERALPQIDDAHAEQPDEASYVDRSLQRLAQTALYTGIVAWLLTCTFQTSDKNVISLFLSATLWWDANRFSSSSPPSVSWIWVYCDAYVDHVVRPVHSCFSRMLVWGHLG